jgi:DDE superfamily endonuclease
MIPGILDKHGYHDILQRRMIPSAHTLFSDGDFIFQEDNDPKHTSKLCQDYLHSKKINRMNWPAQSPDLNPIENLWAILNSKASERRQKMMTNCLKP